MAGTSISPNLILRFEGGFQNRWNTSPPLGERTNLVRSLCLPSLDISSPLVRVFFLPELAGFIWVAVFIYVNRFPSKHMETCPQYWFLQFFTSVGTAMQWWSREDMTEIDMRWPMLPILFLSSHLGSKTFQEKDLQSTNWIKLSSTGLPMRKTTVNTQPQRVWLMVRVILKLPANCSRRGREHSNWFVRTFRTCCDLLCYRWLYLQTL